MVTQAMVRRRLNLGARINSKTGFYRGSPLANECVLYLPGLPGTGSTIYDFSGRGNDGAVVATWSQLNSGVWALDFDGTDDWVDCGTGVPALTGAFTLEAWYNEDVRVAAGRIIEKQVAYQLVVTTGVLTFVPYGTTGNDIASLTTLTLDTWYHIVAVYDLAKSYIYINGAEDISEVSTGAVTTNANKVTLGARQDLAGDLDGLIALARIYSKALSPAEVALHYQQERHLFGI